MYTSAIVAIYDDYFVSISNCLLFYITLFIFLPIWLEWEWETGSHICEYSSVGKRQQEKRT